MKIDLMQLEFIDLNLRKIAVAIAEEFRDKTITSLFRIDDPGVHGALPLRGLDFRCLTKQHGREVENWVNKRWRYDSDRPMMKCCMCHDVGRGIHLHLQTHPNTRKI